MEKDGPRLGDVGVPGRFKSSDDFRLGVGPVTRLARELFSSDARHRGGVRAHGVVGERGRLPRASGEVGLPAKRQGPRAHNHLERRPSSLGLDHGWVHVFQTGQTLPAPAPPS